MKNFIKWFAAANIMLQAFILGYTIGNMTVNPSLINGLSVAQALFDLYSSLLSLFKSTND